MVTCCLAFIIGRFGVVCYTKTFDCLWFRVLWVVLVLIVWYSNCLLNFVVVYFVLWFAALVSYCVFIVFKFLLMF